MKLQKLTGSEVRLQRGVIIMKIAVVAANGRVAKKVIAEALSRGHEVVAFGRHAENDTPAKKYVQKDLFDLTREDLAGFDAVIDAGACPLEPTTVLDLTPMGAGDEPTVLRQGAGLLDRIGL